MKQNTYKKTQQNLMICRKTKISGGIPNLQ